MPTFCINLASLCGNRRPERPSAGDQCDPRLVWERRRGSTWNRDITVLSAKFRATEALSAHPIPLAAVRAKGADMKIGIIGAGNVGSALTLRFTAAGHQVSTWLPEKCHLVQTDLRPIYSNRLADRTLRFYGDSCDGVPNRSRICSGSNE
jgi:hypothetical protein